MDKKIHVLITSGSIAIIVFILIISGSVIKAAPPKSIHYQGRLKINDALVVNGAQNFIFRIYNAQTGGTACWSKTVNNLTVTNGVFEVELDIGDQCASLNGNYWLETTVNSNTLQPREKLLSVSSSINAVYLSGFDGTNANVLGDLALASGATVKFLGTGTGTPNNAAGRRISLFNAASNNQYLIGVDTSAIYFSSPQKFSWYTTPDGTNFTERMKLDNGTLTLNGNANFYGGIWASGGFTCNAGDVAEIVSSQLFEGAAVVCITSDEEAEYALCNKPYDSAVAGVVSINPGLLLNGTDKEGLKLALNGRVMVKVTDENGPIQKGDSLVTSSKPGYAMRGDPEKILRSMLIGKALENMDEKSGEILVLVK